ncbi:CbiX/SirB N-terminal domain-containing protein [Brevibacterium sp. 2SA]|uniref:sirohydrochlorin chelatase n=1 Tax=Brevibacterium sp. 2SA TaxID=2502198 RepID=UPI0010F64710|nr:CbiX/SirB N-terminal domain-containing protein [Brevibacterium sp. 2SA]
MPTPALGLISHGTSSPEGQAVITALAEAVAADVRQRGIADTVILGHVDVQTPDVAEVLRRLPADRPSVLVPLLLSPGYHVHVDLAEAVTAAGGPAPDHSAPDNVLPDGTGPASTAVRDIRVAGTLGPDPRLAELLAQRVGSLGADDEVVLVAAGSSDERANDASRAVGRLLADRLGRPVQTAFLAGEHDNLRDIVEQKSHLGERLVVANLLLAPGYFDDLATRLVGGAGGRLADPLLHSTSPASPLLVDIVRDRMMAVL